MGFGDNVDLDIVNEVAEEYSKASHMLPFTQLQIEEVFTKEEAANIATMLEDMKSVSEDNEKMAKLAGYQKEVFKLLKLAKIAV